ncbi:MAG: IS21-like element helper ATPase IstB [Desulfitobacteriaceae bacterium]|nr:IS21-like element helper ATPase IstB [Desulfitobacteriaceae bacterium]
MLNQQTVDRLHQMRLKGMAECFVSQQQNPDLQFLSFEERFGLIVEHEWTCRQNLLLSRLLKKARLKIAACMEDIDYQRPRGLDKGLLKSMSTCQWIRSRQNVLITGPTGVGKTFIACALANAACRQGLSARYYRTPRLLTDLAIARGDGSYHRLLVKLAKIDLLVLDDWGLAPFTDIQGRDLLEVIDDRSQEKSTVIVSQLPVDHWHAILADPTLADAILDRLVHNAHKVVMRGDSMRKSFVKP